MSISTRLMTADEFLIHEFPPGTRHELIEGEPRELDVPGGTHGRVAGKTIRRIGDFVETHALGETYAAETGFVLVRDPDTVRCPDVSFVRADRLPEIVDESKFLPFPPDLAVEVASPTDRPGDIAEKTEFWLASGTRMVWNFYPKTITATVHRPGADAIHLRADDLLDGGEILPGFRCRLGDLFA